MPAEAFETRTVTTLRTGSKITVLLALPLLGLAAYFYFVPLWVPKADGGVFGCGSAANPPGSWGRGACQGVNDAAQLRAIVALVLAVAIPVLGIALFGVDKKEQRRPVRDDYDEDDDFEDDRYAPRTRAGRGTRGHGEQARVRDEQSRPRARRRYEDDEDELPPNRHRSDDDLERDDDR